MGAIAERLRWQAEACERIGSPLYGVLLRRAADDLDEGGPVAAVLAGREDDRLESMLALRFMGAVHRLALAGRAPALAACYPSTGGPGDAEATWPAFRATVAEHGAELLELVERPVQTNEVGRSAALVGGFLAVAAETGLPLRLLELGASAGLNLRWDRYRYEAGERAFGDPASPVRFRDPFAGEPPPLVTPVTVAERAGCDPAPVDPSTDEGRLTLRSYVWPDQLERLRLLDAGLEVAREVPVTVDRANAGDWLERRLAEPVEGVATVAFHSIAMQYVDPAERERLDALFEARGREAAPDTPLARLAMEHGGEETEVRLTLWPGGEERLLAAACYHGAPVRWLAGPPPT